MDAWRNIASQKYPVDVVHCAPTIIESLYEYISNTGGDFTPLSTLKSLQPGGAKLSDFHVASLVSHGVDVKTTYGSTEIGPPFRSVPGTRDNALCYTFRNHYLENKKIELQDVGDGLYECVVHKGFEIAAELWDGKPDDEPFRTNDLFIQDPPGSGNYVLQGRRDDILVHSDGNNTSAGKLQLEIQAESPLIRNILAIGHSRPCVGLLVEIKEGVNGSSEEKLERVWESVQKVNTNSPRHSHVLRFMIYILPKDISLPVTPKGNVKRNEVLKSYHKVIDNLYRQLEGDDDQEKVESGDSLESTITNLVSKVSGIPSTQIKSSASFYNLGIDSLSALHLRSLLSKSVGTISLGAIFENPSVDKLLSYFSKRSTTSNNDQGSSFIHRKIDDYSDEFSSWPALDSSFRSLGTPHTILLTGASGSLGTALMEKLIALPNVAHIYALVRGPDHLEKLRAS